MDFYHSTESSESDVDFVENDFSPPVSLTDPTSLGHENNSSKPPSSSPAVKITARAYQAEMLEASLQRNIIVAMDTGSGKTLVAVLRIKAELERSTKMVWFLAPTVALATQQFDVLHAQIPGAVAKHLQSAESVDAWSSQSVWDAALENVELAVSTYQILFDAVQHGFVRLDCLSLIVFDEVHNCVKRSSGARLMKEHYWPAKSEGRPVPHIMGLTASPVMGSDLDDLQKLEATMDCVCRSPKTHRDELIDQVNQPEMILAPYRGASAAQWTRTMLHLFAAVRELDIRNDPEILRLKADKSDRCRALLLEAIKKNETPVTRQVDSFCRRAKELCSQIGPWAADYYIWNVVHSFYAHNDRGFRTRETAEKAYLGEFLSRLRPEQPSQEPTDLSNKVQVLIERLLLAPDDTVGIVFVKERVTAVVLAHVLSVHPRTRSRYKTACMRGSSVHASRKYDPLELRQKMDFASLEQFRSSSKNLIVATSVLEEGIDVPACNLVVCFEPVDNLKSFVQRRGRARKQSSQLVLLLDQASDEAGKQKKEWTQLEEEMKRRYQDELREKEKLRKQEEAEESRTGGYPVLRGKGMAQLRLQDAKAHLYHFCASLSSRKFVDCKPYFVIRDADRHVPRSSSENSHLAFVRATVHLPISMPLHLRTFRSQDCWQSEQYACQDASFQAYRALYAAGLLSENLLPLRATHVGERVENRPGMMTVQQQLDPWPWVAQAWRDGHTLSRCRWTLTRNDQTKHMEVEVALPVPLPDLSPFTLYWDAHSSWRVDPLNHVDTPWPVDADEDVDHTKTLLTMAYGHRWPVPDNKQHVVRLSLPGLDLGPHVIGTHEATLEGMSGPLQNHLIRGNVGRRNEPWIYRGWLPSKPAKFLVRNGYEQFEEDEVDVPYVIVDKWPKKAGFTSPVEAPAPLLSGSESHRPYPRVLPVSRVRVDGVPLEYAQLGMFVPAIVKTLEVELLARDLITKRLASINGWSQSLVAMAITHAAAGMPNHYERLEFLGDTILKFCATVHCCSQKLDWPEGYLTFMKDKIVSNSRLCKAAVQFGLDGYIITKTHTLHKWRPRYVDEVLKTPAAAGKRTLSTKTLADVVESLIGAAYLSGREEHPTLAIPRALSCLSLILPEVDMPSMDLARQILFDHALPDMDLPTSMQPLEQLIGYSFRKKSILVEAMTHASFSGPGTHACLERLEFLGDALLDYVVVTSMFRLDRAHWDMHLVRTAVVNSDYLGFLVMEWRSEVPRVDVHVLDPRRRAPNPNVELHEYTYEKPLWHYLRFASPELGFLLDATAARHAVLAPKIREAFATSDKYPWALLSRLQCQKLYSDVFEAVMGAVWVDSGSLEEVGRVAERAGLLPYMRRVLKGGVHLLHPKEELGQLAVRERVDYDDGERVRRGGGEQGETSVFGDREFWCRVSVGGTCLAEVTDGVSRYEVRTRAAEEAVRVLKGRTTPGMSR